MVTRSGLNRVVLAAAVLGVVFASQTSASTYNWVPTMTPNDWNVDGNWDITGFPQNAGDVANVNNNIPAATIVNLEQNLSVGTLNLGDADGTAGFTIASDPVVLTNTLAFDSGTGGRLN